MTISSVSMAIPTISNESMIASQKASITLNATMEVRNKVIEAYQEIMRMSV